ncbi:MAG: hypothetical protein IT318_01440 [Anaerolineales bacterium]|nr:hypothetical protein [Anaerolineales bacterium]
MRVTPRRRLGRGQAFQTAWSPDGARLAVGTSLGVYLLETDSLDPVQFLPADGPVYVVGFSPDGRLLAGGGVSREPSSADLGQVWVWSLASGQISNTLAVGYWVNDLALTAVGAAGGRQLLAVGGLYPTPEAQVWDLASSEPLMTASAGLGAASVGASVALSPDGAQLAVGGSTDGVFIYNARTGELQRALTGLDAPVYDLAFSPEGMRLAAGGPNQAAMWDTVSWDLAQRLPAESPVWRVAFSADGQALAYNNGGSVQVASSLTGQPLRSLPASGAPLCLSFAPDGALRAADNHQVFGLDAAGLAVPARALSGFGEAVQGLAFGPNGRLAASELSALRLWDTGSARATQTWQVEAQGQPAISPDGRQVASGVCARMAADGRADCLQNVVRVWDADSGAEVRSLPAHTRPVSAVAYSPDGRWLASAGADGMVYLWEAATGRRARALAGHTQPVASLAFAPDSQTLASGGHDNVVRLWDVASGAARGTLSGSSAAVLSLAYAPDGALLAAGSAAPDSQLRLWRAADGSLLAALPGHLGSVQALAFHPSGRWLATGGAPSAAGPDDFTLRLWQLTADRTGAELIRALRPHAGAIFAVVFSPDGRQMATGSFDATVQVWEVD